MSTRQKPAFGMNNESKMFLMPRKLLIMLIAFLIVLLLSTSVYAEVEQLDSIVAVVDDDIITKNELKKAFDEIVKEIRLKGNEPPEAKLLTKKVLDKLVMEKLQLDMAEREGIHNDETTLNRSIQKIADQNGLSLTDLIATLQKQGINYKDFRKNVQKQIILQRLQQRHVDSQINISEQDIDNYLFNYKKQEDIGKQYHTAIILISIPEGSTAEEMKEVEKKAQMVKQKLDAGEHFSTIAMTYSDSANALEGGDLGWRKASELPSIIADIPDKLTIGQVSDVIKTPVGYLIVQLKDIKDKIKHEVEESHARHILIKTDISKSKEQAKTQLDQLRLRIIQGESFTTLAKVHSNDVISAQNGGDLGWFKKGVMVPEFDRVIENMQVGELSQIFESPFGFHLVELLEKRKRDDSKEYLRNQVRNVLFDKQVEEKKVYWLRRTRDEAHIEIRLEQ